MAFLFITTVPQAYQSTMALSDIADTIRTEVLDLLAYFCVLLCLGIMGTLHFKSLIAPILGIQCWVLCFFPENICLWLALVGYAASLFFKERILAGLEKIIKKVAPYLFVILSHN